MQSYYQMNETCIHFQGRRHRAIDFSVYKQFINCKGSAGVRFLCNTCNTLRTCNLNLSISNLHLHPAPLSSPYDLGDIVTGSIP